MTRQSVGRTSLPTRYPITRTSQPRSKNRKGPKVNRVVQGKVVPINAEVGLFTVQFKTLCKVKYEIDQIGPIYLKWGKRRVKNHKGKLVKVQRSSILDFRTHSSSFRNGTYVRAQSI